MPSYTFLGAATSTANPITPTPTVTPLAGEARMGSALPYPTLELWRQSIMAKGPKASAIKDLLPREHIRTITSFAHDAELAPIFHAIADTPLSLPKTRYPWRRPVLDVDADLAPVLQLWPAAMRELRSTGLPSQHCDLIELRVGGAAAASRANRIPGLCAAVYLACLVTHA